jgi:hypothetical protein
LPSAAPDETEDEPIVESETEVVLD